MEDIFPGLQPHDRLGIVVRETGGSLGASALILSFATRFYDFYREQLGNAPGRLRIYPEIFVFHAGRRHMLHSSLDIWPRHKEVDVIDEPEHILQAINDRGITRLLVQDMTPVPFKSFYQPGPPEQIDDSFAAYLQESVSSAQKRILSVFAYSPSGHTKGADIEIRSSALAEDNVNWCINSFDGLSEEMRGLLKDSRKSLTSSDGRVSETYRQLEPSDLYGMLTGSTRVNEETRKYITA